MSGAVNASNGASDGADDSLGDVCCVFEVSEIIWAAIARAMPARQREGKLGIGSPNVLAAAMAENPSAMATPLSDPTLAGYRASIDNIDAAVIHMLAERFRITKAVGTYKAAHALPASDPEREDRQIARLRKLAIEAQLDPDFGEKFLRFIIQEVIRHHEQANGGEPLGD